MPVGHVRQFDESTLETIEEGCASRLAGFFPELATARIPVQVTALRGGNARLREAVVLEYAGLQHAIFRSSLPLEFDDRVRLEGVRKGYTTDAIVVAVQYHAGQKAIAVKFLDGPCDWMMQP